MLRKNINYLSQTQRQNRRRIFAGAASLVLASLLPITGVTAPAETTVRIAPLFAFNYLTLGHKSGSIEKAVNAAGGAVEWKPYFPAYAPTAEALRGGSVDFGSGSSTSFISAAAGNKDLVVFAIEKNDFKDQGIIATAKSGIKTLADLRGKKIAVNKGGTGEYLLHLALEKNNIPVDDVNIVYLGPTDAAAAFAQGHIDAWAIWDQFFAAAQTEPGANVVAYAADLGSLNRIIHVTTRKFAEENPALLKAIYEALRSEVETSRQNPDRIAKLNAQAGVPTAVTQVIRTFALPEIGPADESFQKELGAIADFYASRKLTPSRIDVSDTTIDVSKP